MGLCRPTYFAPMALQGNPLPVQSFIPYSQQISQKLMEMAGGNESLGEKINSQMCATSFLSNATSSVACTPKETRQKVHEDSGFHSFMANNTAVSSCSLDQSSTMHTIGENSFAPNYMQHNKGSWISRSDELFISNLFRDFLISFFEFCPNICIPPYFDIPFNFSGPVSWEKCINVLWEN